MDGLIALLFLAVLWMFLAPFFIMGKTGAVEERLSMRIKELKEKLDALMTEMAYLRSEARGMEAASPPVPEITVAPVPESPRVSEEFPPSPVVDVIVPETRDVENEQLSVVDENRWELTVEVPEMSAEGQEMLRKTVSFDDVSSCETNAMNETKAPVDEVEAPLMEKKDFIEEKDAAEPERAAFSFEEIREPEAVATVWSRLLSWLLAEGNIWVCVGVLLFFVGFGLLFSYAIQIGLLTLEMRLAAAAVVGLVMAGFGFRIRERRRTYALILQGGGMGVLYLVVLAATKFNSLSTGLPVLPAEAAVVAMLVLSVFTVMLALLQDYQPLALFAILGGFVAPPLVSTGSRNHVALFSIYTLLNLEILMLAFRRNWRLLNRMGFLLTVGIGTAWGMRDWRPELFSTVEPFLLAFIATYVLIAIRAGRQCPDLPESDGRPRYDADLLLAVCAPFSFFLMQTQVVGHFTYGMAFTCLGLGIGYLAFGAWLLRAGDCYHPMMARLFIALCILFSNLVVPYAFENVASSAIWAIEGAFLIVVASRCGSYKALLGGIVLHIGALGLYSPEAMRLNFEAASGTSPLLVSGTLFALAHWISGFWAARFYPRQEGPLCDDWERWLQSFQILDGASVRVALTWIFTVTGSLWWWWTIGDQIPRMDSSWLSAFSVACVTALAGCLMSARFDWKAARFLLVGPLAVGLAWALRMIPFYIFPFRYGVSFFCLSGIEGNLWLNAFVYWVTIGPSLFMLRETAVSLISKTTRFAALFVGLTLACGAMGQWGLRFGADWARLFSVLPLLGTLLYIPRAHEEALSLFRPFRGSLSAATGLPLLMCLRMFVDSFAWKGNAVQGIFIPVLNPLELWQGFVILSLGLWLKIFFASNPRVQKVLRWVLPALFFIWINQVAARGTWWYSGETYHDMTSVLRTAQYQGIIAILWGVLGLAGVLRGQKTRNRSLWRLGAGLLAVDLFKLLLIDLNRAATLTRILAFLVLGGLFLLIGWAAPLPPKEEERQ